MKIKNKIVMGIDPSINTAGVAVFNNKKLIHADLLKPKIQKDKEIFTGQSIKENKKSIDYIDKARSIFLQIRELVDKYNVDVIILEVPNYWSTAGYMARESGAVHKLTFVVGMIASLDNIVPVNPNGWKGQMKKHVVANRLRLIYKEIRDKKITDHNVIDALGIAHWYIYGKV